jgi:hypothetical protein
MPKNATMSKTATTATKIINLLPDFFLTGVATSLSGPLASEPLSGHWESLLLF